jgi:hypothetical protein
MRIVLLVVTIATLFYLLTGLVYYEGSFDGALVLKPHPTYEVIFGGGEEGTWARHHPGEPLPWFLQADREVVARFSWEQGVPVWVDVYTWGVLVTVAGWVVLSIVGLIRLLKRLARSAEVQGPAA